MRHISLFLVFLFFSIPAFANSVQSQLETLLAKPAKIQPDACGSVAVGKDMIAFYEARSFSPAWSEAGIPTPLARAAIAELNDIFRHGLLPQDYKAACLESLSRSVSSDSQLAAFDVQLTDSLARLGAHLANGKTRPSQFSLIWVRKDSEMDPYAAVAGLLQHENPEAFVRGLAPRDADYWALVEAADEMRIMLKNGDNMGFSPMPKLDVKKIEPGDGHASYIPPLRERLMRTGYLFYGDSSNATYYDDDLVEAVKKFQRYHGMDDDGIIGKMTHAALNTSPEERLDQLYLNMERWRWLPREWDQRTILVNIPTFSLKGLENGRTVMEMKVIVGQSANQTPVFSRKVRYIDINPYWNVPSKIARNELLPKIKKDPEYLKKHNYQIVGTGENAGEVLDPETIDWENETTVPGRIRQNPGGGNALGKIKFIFPNNFDVYMHDTSSRYLFKRAYRALSHGCIRVSDPLAMAEYLLKGHATWTRDRVEKAMNNGTRGAVQLSDNPTVQIMYLTAVRSNEGRILFANDVYSQDKPLWNALSKPLYPTMQASAE